MTVTVDFLSLIPRLPDWAVQGGGRGLGAGRGCHVIPDSSRAASSPRTEKCVKVGLAAPECEQHCTLTVLLSQQFSGLEAGYEARIQLVAKLTQPRNDAPRYLK
jgi:hypothetical protein